MGLEKTTSNKIAFSPSRANIINLIDLQDRELIKKLTLKLTNSIIWPILKKEIIAIQAEVAIWSCPICLSHCFNKKYWIIQVALTTLKYNIKLCPSTCPFQHINHDDSIGLIINPSYLPKTSP
jgi:hypothetical protein